MTQYALVSSVRPGRKVERARQLLKRRLKLLGELRDTHVRRLFIEEQMARFPEIGVLRDSLQSRERRLGKVVLSKVRGFKTRKLRKWSSVVAEELAACPNAPRDRGLLGATVFIAVADAFEEVTRRHRSVDRDKSETIHRTRVAFKKFRYMVESLSPAFTGLGKGQLRRLGNYQRRLGSLQDLEILQAWVARFILEHAGTEATLRPFCRYLARRHTRVLRSCVRRGDDLFQFWSPGGLERNGEPALSRTAA